MAREYDPQSNNVVRMRVVKKQRKLADRKIDVWHAKCAEDGYDATGDTESAAVLAFNGHLVEKHPGKTVKKV